MSDEERRRRKREAARRYRQSGKKRLVNERYGASEKGRAYVQTRAAKQRAERDGSRGTFTADDWRRMLRAFDWCCAYCARRGGDLEIEHVVPLSGGGRHDDTNIVPACGLCNRKKRTKSLPEACLALGVSLTDVSARIDLGKQAFLALAAGQPRPA
jgi:5-methylcytosine-specific restriction endonuclease McrA